MVAVKLPPCNNMDVGSNPAATKNEKWTLGYPPTEGSPIFQQDLRGRPAVLKLSNKKNTEKRFFFFF